MKCNTISPQDNPYLSVLTTIAKPPKTLHYSGEIPTTRKPTVAIVGTRKPTTYGREVTAMLASELARRGIIIVSGLALGVDGIAHRAALEVGGITIAVLANGLPEVYPASHKNLAETMIKNKGLLLSEYPPHSSARPFQFLERNRLVSGLADAVIITEAAARSGTLNTAAHALEQGKEVFVVPGNITSPMSQGCNLLIRQGATPVTTSDDVLTVIAPGLLETQTHLALGSTPLETTILELLQSGVRDGDEILQKADVSATELSTALTMLEINGAIRSLGANQWTLR